MNELVWQIPLSALVSFVIGRLLLAPYWIYKEKEKEANALKEGILNLKRELQAKE